MTANERGEESRLAYGCPSEEPRILPRVGLNQSSVRPKPFTGPAGIRQLQPAGVCTKSVKEGTKEAANDGGVMEEVLEGV